ncbi:hypothetical protein [Parasphingorhabdus flavimaris]|uniref:hypothetical protein n=1 Tax=Parasphingorhabdus flavimaris TaxID=266812 RepID=UPI0030010BA1
MKLSRRTLIGAAGISVIGIGTPGVVSAQSWRGNFGMMPRFKNARSVKPPNPRAEIAMNLITDAVGIERTIKLYSAHITKTRIAGFATTLNGTRYIVYDRAKVPWPETITPWTSVFLMAHEVGHHVAVHNFRKDIQKIRLELEADRFAGFALSRLGATEAQATYYYRGNGPETITHPSSLASTASARAGWKLGERMKRREQS